MLPIHPGDRVVAVCILVIAILDGVGGAGAICGGSRGQLGLLHLVFPQDAPSSELAIRGRAGHLSISPPQLQPLPITHPSRAGANNSLQQQLSGMGRKQGRSDAGGSSDISFPGRSRHACRGLPALPGGQAGGGVQQAACRAPPTLPPPQRRARLTAGGDVLRGLAGAQGQRFLIVILRWGSGGQRRSRVHRNLWQKHHRH